MELYVCCYGHVYKCCIAIQFLVFKIIVLPVWATWTVGFNFKVATWRSFEKDTRIHRGSVTTGLNPLLPSLAGVLISCWENLYQREALIGQRTRFLLLEPIITE